MDTRKELVEEFYKTTKQLGKTAEQLSETASDDIGGGYWETIKALLMVINDYTDRAGELGYR